MMVAEQIDMDRELCLARVLEICGYFDPWKPWKRLFAMNRCRHPAGGTFVPYREGFDGIHYRLADVLVFISQNAPNMTPEQAKEVLEYQEGKVGVELKSLLDDLDGPGAIPQLDVVDGCLDADCDTFEGCVLGEEDFHNALRTIFEVEDGIRRSMDHLIALTKLCEGMAATRAKPDEPTAEYLSSFGWTAINDADKLLFKLQNLANLLDRNCDQHEEETATAGDGEQILQTNENEVGYER